MSAEIVINNETVLKTSSGVFETLYYTFEEIVDEKGLCLTSEMLEFMNAMKIYSDNCSYFFLNKFIKKSESVHTLLDILEEAIGRLKNKVTDFTINALWGFYEELMRYGNELARQGK